MNDVNEVLTSVTLMQRIIPRLHGNTRETIRATQLNQISQSLVILIRTLKSHCTEPLILTPIMEVMTLIDTITQDDNFIETDDETKKILVDKLTQALDHLYVFAGKFYMTHDFTWAMTKTGVLRDIVDNCMESGFYFGYDKKLQEEGLI